MTKYISPTRCAYEVAYKRLRLYGGWLDGTNLFHHNSDAEDCALLSYDYYGSVFDGWINRHRKARFLKLRYTAWTREGFPF